MKKVTLILAAVLFSAGATFAQDNNDSENARHGVTVNVPTVALVDVEDADGNESDISFTFNESDLVLEAGGQLVFDNLTNSDLYLQYTSIVANGEHVINASLENSTGNGLPTGLNLAVSTANESVGEGKGTTGLGVTTYQNLVAGSTNAVQVVEAIGTCYTGTGGAKGHQLTYKLSILDSDAAYNSLFEGSYSTTVLYTITAGTAD